MDNWRVWIGVGKWELLKACLSRKYFLQYTFKLCQVGLESFILLFYHQMLLLYFINNFPSFQLVVFGNYCHDSWRHICGYIVLWCCCDLWQCLMDWLKFPWSFQGFLFSTSKRDCLFFPSWVYALPPWNPKNSHDFFKKRMFGVSLTDVIGFEPYVWR